MPNEIDIEHLYGAQLKGRSADLLLAQLAARQHGVVDRDELLGIGLGRGAIRKRVDSGRLHLVYRGVYAVGHPKLTREGEWMAAVRAGRPDAHLSHRSAASLYCLLKFQPATHEVTAPRQKQSRGPLKFYWRELPEDEVTTHDGIPATTIPRTIFDLAAVAPKRHVERAIDEAEVRRLTDKLSLPDLLERYPGARGTAVIRAILEAGQLGATITRGDLEELFIAFCDEHGLPRPQMNVPIQLPDRWIEADCVWHDKRVIVELDDRMSHDRTAAFEKDRSRDRMLSVNGWTVIRITAQQLMYDAREIAADLRRLLH
ncbi:MAG TPA: type IV toxin-antitoxin system AbiEi family antitoxin domain-containing protein [Thermoleophilaceae bacterium]